MVVAETGLPVIELGSGVRLTLLSPGERELARLYPHWSRELQRHGIAAKAKGIETEGPDWNPTTASTADSETNDPRLYIGYAHEDKEWLAQLERYLALLEDHARVAIWSDDILESGDVWKTRMEEKIANADIALLLVSPNFLASEYNKQELHQLFSASEEGRLLLTWILLEPCPWDKTPLAKLQPLLDPSHPPLSMLDSKERDRAMNSVVEQLVRLIPSHRMGSETSESEGAEDSLGLDIESLARTQFINDRSESNASSIAFFLESGDGSLLVGGDANDEVLKESIRRLLDQRGLKALPVGAFVVPHGGSSHHLSPELLELISCDRYLISSNGDRFGHPHRETIARIITYGRRAPERGLTLIFNYRSAYTEIWADEALQSRYNYQVLYPESGGGIKVVL
ncbi:MAG: TIR domain-containing protein [Candidatus Thiodiazotropha sp.]